MIKPLTLLYWRFAVQYPQTSTFRHKNKTYFTLNLVQNWTSLLTASKNSWKWLKNCYDSSALKKYRVLKLKFFSLFFFLCFFGVHYFSFALLTIIRTTKWQRTHINKASNINKIINYDHEIMTKSSVTPYWIFQITILCLVILESLFPVVTYKITLASLKYLYAHKTQTFLWLC